MEDDVTHEEARAYRFEFYDEEPNEVASALAALLVRNVDRCPARARTAQRIPRPVVVHDSDTETTVTLAFEQDRATLYNERSGWSAEHRRAGRYRSTT